MGGEICPDSAYTTQDFDAAIDKIQQNMIQTERSI